MLARSLEQVFAWRRELCADVVRQGALAASHQDRAQEQVALVGQPRADFVASELGTPDSDVGPRGWLVPPDRCR